MKITQIKAVEILDSRGKPTVRTFVKLEDGSIHQSSVPSGASTGTHEAVELRDKDPKRHHGQGVLQAVNNVNTILAKAVVGMDSEQAKEIDQKMLEIDGTENKAKLGANAILSISQAIVKAQAHLEKKPLWQYLNQYYFSNIKPCFPRLMVNVVNGGKHAAWNFDIQEFMISPKTNIPSKSTQIAAEIFHALGKNLKNKKLSTLVGDEGGYSPLLSSNDEVLKTIVEAASEYQYTNNKEYNLALDSAATEFYSDEKYILKKNNKELTGDDLIQYYLSLQKEYNIISFEDPFAENDWKSFKKLTQVLGLSAITVGDDLYVTNPKRIKRGIEDKTTTAVLIKPNQIGSIMETALSINMAKKSGLKVVISHRSGETEDSFIADLAYGCGADFIKTGSMSRSERLCKYNRLIEIENGF